MTFMDRDLEGIHLLVEQMQEAIHQRNYHTCKHLGALTWKEMHDFLKQLNRLPDEDRNEPLPSLDLPQVPDYNIFEDGW